MRRIFSLLVPLSLALTVGCAVERDMDGYANDSRFGNLGVALGRDLAPYEARLRGSVGGVQQLDSTATVTEYSESNYSNLQLDVYDGDIWAMAGLDISGSNADLTNLQVGDTLQMNADYNEDMQVYGIGCSSSPDTYFDEPFEEMEITVGEADDPDVKVIAFTGRFQDGNTLMGAYAMPADQ